jgi:hypothetical protein
MGAREASERQRERKERVEREMTERRQKERDIHIYTCGGERESLTAP